MTSPTINAAGSAAAFCLPFLYKLIFIRACKQPHNMYNKRRPTVRPPRRDATSTPPGDLHLTTKYVYWSDKCCLFITTMKLPCCVTALPVAVRILWCQLIFVFVIILGITCMHYAEMHSDALISLCGISIWFICVVPENFQQTNNSKLFAICDRIHRST